MMLISGSLNWGRGNDDDFWGKSLPPMRHIVTEAIVKVTWIQLLPILENDL